MPSIDPRLRRLAPYVPHAVLAGVLVVGLLTIRDYGVTTDEPLHVIEGDNWLRFITSLDRQYLPQGWAANYAPLVDILGAALTRAILALGGHDEYLGRHITSFALGWLGLLGTWRLGRRVLPGAAATLALVLLVLVPRYYGASFNNPKDIPFACGFVWAMFGLVRMLEHPTPRNAALCGALAAFCTATRAFGALFIPLGMVACLLPLRPPAADRKKLLAIQLGCAMVLTIVLWPILWVTPPWHIVKASIALASPHAELPPFNHVYMGEVYRPYEPPASYALVWIAITLPVPTLLLVLTGAWTGLRRWRVIDRRRAWWTAGLVGLWLVVPVLVTLLRRVPMHNAVRHFLFMMPGLCILAAYGAQALFEAASVRWRRLVVLAAAIGFGDVLVTAIALHPYEDLYFSRVIGGLRGAQGRFDTAYYSETIRECFLWLRDHEPAPVRVWGTWRAVPNYYAAKLGMPTSDSGSGYDVAEVRLNWDKAMSGEIVYQVVRDGVPLAVVIKPPPMDAASGWWRAMGSPWAQLPMEGARLGVPDDAAVLALAIDSPRDQSVPVYLGYVGRPRIRLGGQTHELPAVGEDAASPARFRIDVHLVAGHNYVLLDPQSIDRHKGLYVAYPGNLGLSPAPSP
jgi:hypothetical protein